MATDLPEPRPEPPTPSASPVDWPIRVLALVPLVAMALLWSNHHLGVGAGHAELMAALAAALPVAIGLITQLLDKPAQEGLLAHLRNGLAKCITWKLIVVLYLALAFIVLTWSSLVVAADDGKVSGNATLVALDDPAAQATTATAQGTGDQIRFIVATRPFGRSFRLELDGYVPQTVEVYPLLGLRVRTGRDLRHLPSVLLRFSELAVGTWRDTGGAELRVYSLDTKGKETPLASTTTPTYALLLGRPQPIPAALSADWRAELAIKGVTSEAKLQGHLLGWKRPQLLPSSARLGPGMTIRVTLTNSIGNVVARTEFVLGRDELQDQPVEDL